MTVLNTNPEFKIEQEVNVPMAWNEVYGRESCENNVYKKGKIVGLYITVCYCYVVHINDKDVPFTESELLKANS
jgi:hypothetical protein